MLRPVKCHGYRVSCTPIFEPEIHITISTETSGVQDRSGGCKYGTSVCPDRFRSMVQPMNCHFYHVTCTPSFEPDTCITLSTEILGVQHWSGGCKYCTSISPDRFRSMLQPMNCHLYHVTCTPSFEPKIYIALFTKVSGVQHRLERCK